MAYHQNLDGCFHEKIGKNGLSATEFATSLSLANKAVPWIAQMKREGSLPLLGLPERENDLPELEAKAVFLRQHFENIVIVGIGGSSLGAQVLSVVGTEHSPYLHFWENLDYNLMARNLAKDSLETTAFLFVSKSGSTPEIMAQSLVVIDALNKAGGKSAVSRHCVAICEAGENSLGKLAERWDIERFDHDPEVGGRYSVLSLVGILPALIVGVDAKAMRQGASLVLATTLRDDAAPVLQGAAANHAFHKEKGIGITALVPYAELLEPFCQWFRQLWAESIGKDGTGTTPLNALGPIDQHSQMQLWLDGPVDKFFTLVDVLKPDEGPRIDVSLSGNDPALGYLDGHQISDVVAAEFKATFETLMKHGRPVRHISLDALDAFSLGQLLMHYMLETIVTCHMFGVNPFDQPAVEEGKILTKQYLRGDL
jgi:glucose-6-phosphate isomerase